MAISAFSGPLVSFGQSASGALEYNPEIGPSLFTQGWGLLDPRAPYTYQPGRDAGRAVYGFLSSKIMTLSITPATKSATAIAAAANTVSGTAMTLASSDANGIVVNKSITRADTGATVTGLLAVGQVTSSVSFGQAGTVRMWDPTTLTARTVIITCNNASGAGGAFVIRGYDIYGYPMSETVTSAPGSALTVESKKAFKYIASVTPGFTDASYTYAVGTTDTFGLPIASNYWADIAVNHASAVITASTGYTAAVTTTPSATTGDVRGTYTVQTAADGSRRLVVYQYVLPSNIALANGVAGASTGLFGVTQYSA